MVQSIAMLTLVVRDYDEAIAFFTDAMPFEMNPDLLAQARGAFAGRARLYCCSSAPLWIRTSVQRGPAV